MKKFKRLVVSTMAAVMALSTAVGCAKEEVINYPSGTPELTDTQEMMVGAYWCPEPTLKAYQDAKAAGITHMMVNKTLGHPTFDSEGFYWLPTEYAAQAGLKVIMHSDNSGYKVLLDYFEDMKTNPVVEGVIGCDEPNVTKINMLAQDYQDFKEEFPDTPYWVNLFPDYATSEQLGGVTWEQYVDTYKEKMLSKYDPNYRILMCDCYPLMNGTNIYAKWLYNLEYVRSTADSVNAELQMYMQAQGFLNRWRQPTRVSELTYQLYVYLAYGVSSISYYPWLTPGGGNDPNKGPIAEDNTPTYIYDFVKATNDELQGLDGAYLGFDWKAVIGSVGSSNFQGEKCLNFTNCKNLKSKYGVVGSVNSTKDALVGCFENEDGYQGFIVANFDQPKSTFKNTVTLNFRGGVNKAIVYVKGVPQTVDLTDGKLTHELKAGEGLFVVPYKG